MEAPRGHSRLSPEVWKEIFTHLPMRWRAMCCRVCKAWQENLEQPQQRHCDDVLVDYGLGTLCSVLATEGVDEVMRRIHLHHPSGIAADLGRMDQVRRFVQRHRYTEIKSVDEWMQLASQEPDAGWLCKGASKTQLEGMGKSLMRQVVGKPQEFSKLLDSGTSRHASSVCYSPDGSTIACACDDKTVRLLDAKTMQEKGTLRGHSDWVTCVAYSPDGKHVASAGFDFPVKIWDAETKQEVCTLKGHRAGGDPIYGVYSVAYSPDGSQLASADHCSDNAVRLWDPKTMEHEEALGGRGASWMHLDPETKAFAAKVESGGSAGSNRTGQYIVTANDDMVYVYRTDSDGEKHGEPLACFLSPSRVTTVGCKGTSVFVKCHDGQVSRYVPCGANAAVF